MTMLLDNAIVIKDGMVLDVTVSVIVVSGDLNVAIFVIARIIRPVTSPPVSAYAREGGLARIVTKFVSLDTLDTIVQKHVHFALTVMELVTMSLDGAIVILVSQV